MTDPAPNPVFWVVILAGLAAVIGAGWAMAACLRGFVGFLDWLDRRGQAKRKPAPQLPRHLALNPAFKLLEDAMGQAGQQDEDSTGKTGAGQ